MSKMLRWLIPILVAAILATLTFCAGCKPG
jgi:hypothetical protein